MKLFLNWNGRNAIVAAAIGYVSTTVSSSFTSSSSSGGQQQQQGFGFLLFAAAECTCEVPGIGYPYPCSCPNPNAQPNCKCPLIASCNDDDAEIKLKDKDKGTQTCQKIKKKKWCDEEVKNSDGLTAVEFCYSCDCDGGISQAPTEVTTGVPTASPSGVPTLSTPDDKCKGDDDKIDLKKEGPQKCSKIKTKKWCDEKVVDGGTAKKFCSSCGCGDDPVPTPSPPDDDCKGDDDKIELENEGKKECSKILEKNWCEEKVVGGGRAKKFCTSCGCGVDPVRTLIVSPPDDDCKGDEDEINLKNKGPQTCATIFKEFWCGKQVEGGGGDDECAKCTKAVPKFVKNNQSATEEKQKKCVKMCTKKKNKVKKCDTSCCEVMCAQETTEAACIKTNYCAPPVLRLTAVSDKGSTDRCGEEDWVEFTNTGNTTINLTGYILHDDKGVNRPNSEAFTFDDSYSIEADAIMLLCKDPEGPIPFGIGGDDTVTLLDADGKKVDTSGKLKDEGKLNYVWTRTSSAGDWVYVWTNETNVTNVDDT